MKPRRDSCEAHYYRRDDKEVWMKDIILIFNRPILPEYINAGLYIAMSDPTFQTCAATSNASGSGTEPTLAMADLPMQSVPSKTTHLKTNLQNLMCINCQDPHAAYSRTCERSQAEKKIINIKVTENISFP